ncbi:uncharacterized protein LOC126354452 [Schistocerca gregaria]|uniref:uncharacterized protein LOC126354452 n=1 Tax=Schistocerca gregaria TaxID=7010 RepID=UPI00211E8821|nr:uncharacterized protein LOC126354452 [Schistocerca gregaria]
MVMVKPLFHRVLQYEECSVMIKAIKKLKEYIDEIMLHAKRIIGFFSKGEHETLEFFMKTSKEWLCYFDGEDKSSKTCDQYLPDDEDIHLKYSYLNRRRGKDQTDDTKEKFLVRNKDERKHNNIEDGHTSNHSHVKLEEYPFKHIIPYFMKTEHPPDPKGQFMKFYHETKAYSETSQKLYMLQTLMIYIVDTQKKVMKDEARIFQLRDDFENIEEALIQVIDFICKDKGSSTTHIYENKLLEIKKVTQPMYCHVVQQEEWPKMMRLMRIMKSLCYRLVFRIQQWHFLNIFSQEMIARMKIHLDDVSDWMVDVSNKISAFETCERIEESQRLNNLLPNHEALYSRIIRRIQKLKDNENDDLDVWMSCLYHRDLGFTRPVIDVVPNANELSSDDDSSCEGMTGWWRSAEVGVTSEMTSASVDSHTINASHCCSHPVSIGDLRALDPSVTGNKETGADKKNTGQGDTFVTEKMEAKPSENSVSNIVLEIVKSEKCHMPLDMTVIMWLCALFYFWKHLSGLD